MNHSIFYLFLSISMSVILPNCSHLIQQPKKTCRDCKFFIANHRKCSKVVDVDLVTGDHYYHDAHDVRRNENECGQDAKLFKKNHYKLVTVPYYFLCDYWFFVVWLGLYSIVLTVEISSK